MCREHGLTAAHGLFCCIRLLGLPSPSTTHSRTVFARGQEARSLKSSCGQGWLFLEALRKNLPQALLLAFGNGP